MNNAESEETNAESELNSLIDLALHHYNAKQLIKAEEAYQKILAIIPNWAEAHSNLGVIFEEQGSLSKAEEHYRQASELKPNSTSILYNLANIIKAQGKFDEAVTQYKRVLLLDPNYADAYNNLGVTFKCQDKLEEAVEQYKQALEINPDFTEAHNNLGNAFKELGKLNEAKWHYKRALELKPDYAEAYYNYSDLETFNSGDAYFLQLKKLADNTSIIPDNKKVYIHFSLAKAFDDIGDYKSAFNHLIEGNALKRKIVNYNEAGVQNAVKHIREVYTSSFFQRYKKAGAKSPAPIFIVGMPRSGTTLIEQILASHPDVYAAGELNNLNLIAENDIAPYATSISGLTEYDLQQLGKNYLKRLPQLPSDKIKITDKRPLNFFYIGLIRLILPNSKIIHVSRHPVATCFSCFTKLFSSDLGFVYDLAELGRYYSYYNKLMNHWESVLPQDTILNVCYEDVVSNIEEQVKRILNYCGLTWNERCLCFYETDRGVITASSVQVRKPLFHSSVEKWHQYETYLEPLLAELNTINIAE